MTSETTRTTGTHPPRTLHDPKVYNDLRDHKSFQDPPKDLHDPKSLNDLKDTSIIQLPTVG